MPGIDANSKGFVRALATVRVEGWAQVPIILTRSKYQKLLEAKNPDTGFSSEIAEKLFTPKNLDLDMFDIDRIELEELEELT